MNPLSSENIQEFVEKASKSSVDVVKSQAGFLEEWARRNAELFSSLADAHWASMKELTSAKTFSQVFETNLALGETVRGEITHLHEENLKAWDQFQEDIKSIYTPKSSTAKKAPARKAA